MRKLNKHVEKEEKSKDVDENESEKREYDANAEQMRIKEALQNQEKLYNHQKAVKDAAIRSEAMLVTVVTAHNLPEAMFDCFANLLPKLAPDSEVVKNMQPLTP